LLVLANKQDIAGALSSEQIATVSCLMVHSIST
jgi:signal recognition particle receptor subunit beta